MRKTLNINLGGVAFIIDENAYELLYHYLEALKHRFGKQPERDEILSDIEARMAELLQQKLGNRKEVVTVQDMEPVIAALGRPEDIAGEESGAENTATTGSNAGSSNTPGTSSGRRLFRDPDDKRVGGVISGLCHYFGISDPTWARLAVVLLLFVSFGTVLLVYFLLLIIVPEAQTAAEKLQMKGEPINISTIEKEVREAANRAGESVNGMVNAPRTLFEKVMHLIIRVAVGLFKVVAGFVVVLLLIVLAVLVGAFFGVSFTGSKILESAPQLLIADGSVITAFKLGLLLVVAAPSIAVIYAALRLIFGRRTQVRWLKWSLLGAWVMGLGLLFYAGIKGATELSTEATKTETITLLQPPSGSRLLVQLTDTIGNKLTDEDTDWDNASINITSHGILINGVELSEMETIPVGEPSLQLMPSTDSLFYIQKVMSSRGKTKGDALTNTGYIVYNIAQTDSLVNLPGMVYLNKNGRWRGQEVRIRIAIPEGKEISFADNIDKWAATVRGDDTYDDTYFANTTWTVQNGKVKCIKGENHFNAEKPEEPTPPQAPGEEGDENTEGDF